METEGEILLLKRMIERERKAREVAENLLDEKSSQLYASNLNLKNQLQEVEFLHSLALLNTDSITMLDFFLKKICILLNFKMGLIYIKNLNSSDANWEICASWESDYSEKTDSIKAHFPEELTNELSLKLDSIADVNYCEIKNQAYHSSTFTSLIPNDFKFIIFLPIIFENNQKIIIEFFHSTNDFMSSHEKILINGATQLKLIIESKFNQDQLQKSYEELKKAQQQLVHSEKMATLGIIAAGVAHEINNPLCFLISNNDSLKSYLESITSYNIIQKKIMLNLKEKNINELNRNYKELKNLENEYDFDFINKDCITLIEENLFGLNRVKEIVHSLKKFSRIDEAEVTDYDINECIKLTLKILANELKHKITLDIQLKEIPKLFCYPGQLTQVFTNIIVNSIHAIKKEGIITIRTFHEDEKIVIQISDTGIGMTSEILEKIFNPFFTTKSSGQGTGLGLSITYEIIQKHGGTIDVTSEVNIGTMFTIKLPIINNIKWTNHEKRLHVD